MMGTQKAVKVWSLAAKITEGKIYGPTLTTTPDCLQGPDFTEHIMTTMIDQGVPIQIAEAFAISVWQSWEKWAKSFYIPALPIFPSFAAFSGPAAPPTPSIPIQLTAAVYDRSSLKADAIKKEILDRLGMFRENLEAQRSVERFAEWLDNSFTVAISRTQIINLMGRGQVPTFAPPLVPVGPVVDGEIISTSGCFAQLSLE